MYNIQYILCILYNNVIVTERKCSDIHHISQDHFHLIFKENAQDFFYIEARLIFLFQCLNGLCCEAMKISK